MSSAGSHVYDFALVGGGIVGLASALALSERFPAVKILLLEKEKTWAFHQTGHNSGVIHSGIYYAPGSLKARLAREGNRAMVEFCSRHEIEHVVCGKVIVATDELEIEPLNKLFQRGRDNGLEVELIDARGLKELEPNVEGIAAIRVPSAGIVDYRQVAAKYAALLQERGAELRLHTRAERLDCRSSPVEIGTSRGSFRARFLITCAGLQSDRIARLAGIRVEARIVPFRGEYHTLRPERASLVKNLVYPVPNPEFPFLGVHFTRMINGEVHAGPNAVLAFKREGYSKTDFSARDLAEVLTFPGFWRLALRHWREALKEYRRSFSTKEFARSLQRLVPAVQPEDIVPSEAGVRAQALGKDGHLVDDFLIVPGPNSIHVCNAPSPAATASLEIGKHIAAEAAKQIGM